MTRLIINSIYDATEKARDILEKRKYIVDRIKQANFGRHRILEVYRKVPAMDKYIKKWYKVYIVYQREPLHKFSKIYKYEEDTEGVGINYEILKGIVDAGFNLIMFVFRDGRVYAGKPDDILADAEDYGWIRESKKTKEKIVNYPVSKLTLLE